jgi:hypothetical protein
VPCVLERPSNPMRLRLIGRVETNEELLSHQIFYWEESFGDGAASDYRLLTFNVSAGCFWLSFWIQVYGQDLSSAIMHRRALGL